MHGRLRHHLHTNDILVTEQYGFRKKLSTKDAAFGLTDSVFQSINQKIHIWRIFCDLAKNHEILLAKLRFYGNRGVYEDWFRSCLTDESQKVDVKPPNTSKKIFSPAGVSWNMEFSYYLCLRINSVSEPVLFTDDSSVIISSRNFKNFCSLSNLVVPHMIEWFAANKLVLNLGKQ